jgi:hypothetical protein
VIGSKTVNPDHNQLKGKLMNIMRKDILMKDPAHVFKTPTDLFENEELSKGQKIAVLEQWKDEIILYFVAEDESMAGNPENAERLKLVSDALIALKED